TATIDDRDVRNAATILEETAAFPSEVERFWTLIRDRVLPQVRRGQPIQLEARLSEPPELRAQLAEEARLILIDEGADPAGTEVRVLSAFKQGYSWLEEVVLPRLAGRDIGEVVIRFRRNDPPAEWPQQAIHTPLRWLHEIFPIDEVLARELAIDLEQIRFEETTEGPTYEVSVTTSSGSTILTDSFEPRYLLRPYFDRFRDYEHVRVTTGWLVARDGQRELVSERIITDPEAFWDYYQADILPAVYDYVMALHEGLPRGGSIDAPFFGELVVELEMSEPDYRLGVDNEIHAPMDALHEEIYFGTLEFFEVLGRNSRGQGLAYPGRIIPVVRAKSDGSAARARVRLTGFATSRPAVVVAYRDVSGAAHEVRLDIPKTTLARPSARVAKVRVGQEGLDHLALRVRVDTELDARDSLLTSATPEQVDRTMVSAQQVVASLHEIEALRGAGLYTADLAYRGLGSIEVWAEWTHEQDPESRAIGYLSANGAPAPAPDWRTLVPADWSYEGGRIVQWDTPMPPAEGHEVLGKLASTFDEPRVYRIGRSYLGQDIWAMDLMPPVSASHWSRIKATTYKPTVIYSAREHANEVSSTSHILRHAELLLTDPDQRAKLDRVNVVIHPFTNPDGAQLAYDLYTATPDYILHAGYLASLGQGATADATADHPIYPEAPVRNRLWSRWLPDVFLNPHGYPSHQVVQLFSEYTGLVRRGRVTERNWGFNKGWFMPGFEYVDDPDFPRHKDAAFELRDYITSGINSNPEVVALNQRAYGRYDRYGAQFDSEVFRLPMTQGVLIEMPLKGSSGDNGGNGGYDAEVTIWSGTTEAPDETAYGPWMELVATAGLSWDQAVLDYLHEGDHEVKRSGSAFFGGVSLRVERPRPPEVEDEEPGS
ncbi:MAG: M14 family metallopeptidase, partial [Gemmatimonadota bacterium]|nr:M14 family metallopeptidase [Gemmatimonadota bacterium]